MIIFRKSIQYQLLLFVFFFPAASWAQTKPADVLALVQSSHKIVESLYQADLRELTPVETRLHIADRLPRHVLQKAREVHGKVQLLRYLNGLPSADMPKLLIQEITPNIVAELVSDIRFDLLDLATAIGLPEESFSIEPVSNATPTDVYRSLTNLSFQLDQLDLPEIVPNDVFRIAQTIQGQIASIHREVVGQSASIPSILATNKSPKDAFENASRLLDMLAQYETAPKGGVKALNEPKGDITPTIVFDALSNILAEVIAIRVSHDKARDRQVSPPQQFTGKTPSEVFASLSASQEILRNITQTQR